MKGRFAQARSAVAAMVEGQDPTRLGLLAALLALSWWSTTQGLLALISAGSGAPGPLVTVTIGFAVLVLTVLISWTVGMLRSGETGPFAPLFLLGYLLLTCISVGFGFGFYWTHIESRASAQRAAEAETERLSRELSVAYGRLSDSLSALDAVAVMSETRAAAEASDGGTCGLGAATAGAGAGPRYRLRTRDAETMTALKDRIRAQVGTPATAVADDQTLLGVRARLDGQLSRLDQDSFAALPEAEARVLLTETQRTVSEAVARYEAFRTGSAVSGAVRLLRDRIELGQGTITDGDTAFTCPDPGLEVVLSQAAETLSSLPPLPETNLRVPLGADATVAAFGKLANTALWPVRRGPDVQRLAGRDLVPLGVAVAVDLFILLLSVRVARKPGARDPSAVAAWLEKPQALRELVGQDGTSRLPTHTELLEHTFWWRGAYHLALPVAGPGEAPITPAQQGMTLMAMVLADAGVLVPVQGFSGRHRLKQKLGARFGRTRSWPLRKTYELYRFEQNGLARMTAMLMPEGDAQRFLAGAQAGAGTTARKGPAVETEPGDWRLAMQPINRSKAARAAASQRREAAAAPEKAAQTEKKSAPAPSAYWRSLKPIPRKKDDGEG